MEREEQDISGMKVRFLRYGSGQPLLVMSGLLGADASAAVQAVRCHEAYAPDIPGFWGSEAPFQELTIPWVNVWLGGFHQKVMGPSPISAIGFSAGATILIQHVAAHRCASRLVLYEPIVRGGELPAWLRKFIFLSNIPGMDWVALKAGPNLLPLLPGVNHVGWKKRNRMVQGATTPRCAGQLARSLLRCDVGEALMSIRDIPVMIVHGSKESFVPLSTLRAFKGGNVSLFELSGQHHLLGRDGQRKLVEATAEFLAPSGGH